ncbi:hypothetical protein GDO86_014500 [Hymenochirus boettgeri]|uniref:Prostacyclin synthase n=1 Tax=Hymenochirus boettgeri TaxID=247094 RepID=A0A8T2JS00_9PIPI|nr:hypothetical protein GDO86_014500 [Hymenochirus boettgeri]
MSWAGISLLLLLPLLIAFWGLRRIWRTRKPNEPPLDRGVVPWLGHALEFGKDSAEFLTQMKEKHGDIFTVEIAGKFVTFLLDPHSFDAVFWAPSDKLDFGKYAEILMDRMFDVRLPTSNMNKERAVLKSHFQNESLTDLTKSMFHNLNIILLNGSSCPISEWKEEGLLAFVYKVMLRAGYLTLFGRESEQHSDSHSPAKDVRHSQEVYKEFRKLDQLLMKAARKTLSRGEKKEADAVKRRLCQLVTINSHKDKYCKSSWFEYYRRHLEEIEVNEEMQSRALILQLWATQGNVGPATFWLILYLLKSPEAMLAVKGEFERTFQSFKDRNTDIKEINQDLLDNMFILDSALNEALRLTAAPFITREVLADMSLKLADGREFRLRRHDRVCLFPYVSPQMDPEVYRDPEVFQYDRFLSANGTEKTFFYKNGKKLKYPNLPWGAGSNVCVGKRHAVNSIKQFVCLLFFYFDFELKNPSEKIPEFDRSRYGFGVVQPNQDISFKYRRKS